MSEKHGQYEFNHEGLPTLYVDARFDMESREQDGADQWLEFWAVTEFSASYDDFELDDELAALDMIFSRPFGEEKLLSIKEQIKNYIMKEFDNA
jgi:hypothetical protein